MANIRTLLTWFYTSHSDVTQKETDEIGNISSIPNIVFIFLFPIDGAIMDYWKNHSKMTMTAVGSSAIHPKCLPLESFTH